MRKDVCLPSFARKYASEDIIKLLKKHGVEFSKDDENDEDDDDDDDDDDDSDDY